jgi:hypothetical protein
MIHEVQDVEQIREDFKNSRKPIKTYNNATAVAPTLLEAHPLFDIFLNIHLYISNLFNSI